MTNKLYSFYQELKNDSLSFIYNGEVSDEVTSEIIRLTDHNVTNIEELSKIRNRVSFIMVECFQNLVRYGNTDVGGSLFSTRMVGDANYVSSINKINIDEIGALRDKLETINHLEKDKLKALYMEVLQSESMTDKGGAGVGLIQIARKTGRPVDFDFEQIDERLSNFYMSLKLTGSKEDRENDKGKALRFTHSFDSQIKDSNVLMIYQGSFALDSIMPLIAILEERIGQLTDGSNAKAFFVTLVELLQNVSRHSIDVKDRSGIFMITENSEIGVHVGNVVDTNTKDQLTAQMDKLNGLDASELKTLYKKTLREGTFSDKGGAGLGLIEIARKTSGKLQYSFDMLEDNRYFFTFSVTF